MNIKEFKNYIKDLPDDMGVELEIDYGKYTADLKIEDNKLILW